ncbi:hypothetical protein HBI65_161820 [Parastagonospora nodorum]|nr:hypothetical protein HBI33_189470 [Parastagonospora nodorum]KAH6091228.1 hypothetical protein HBI65_161820 [Parastagonospora nodorum]
MKRDALPLDDFLDAGHFGQSWHMPDDEMARIQLAGTKSSLMRDVTLRKGNWDMGWNTFALYTVLSQKTHHVLPRVQSNRRTAGLSWAGDDDRRLAATMRPCFPRFGAGVEQTPQPGIHARALCGLRLLAHARSDMSTRSADEDCPAGPGKGDGGKAGCMPESEEARLFAAALFFFASRGIRPHHRVRVASPLRRLLSVSVETLPISIFES